MIKFILTAFAFLLALLGYALSYINKEKIGRHKSWLVVVGVVLTFTIMWGNYCQEVKESAAKKKESAFIKSQLTEIRRQNDTLKLQLNETVESNKKLLGYIEPLGQIWLTRYPTLGPEEAFAAIAHDVQRKGETVKPSQTPLIFLSDKTKVQKTPDTGFIHTYYFFRSRYTIPLRDIMIRLRFDVTLISAHARIMGAFVIEQGSKLDIDADSSGFSYSTGYLSESNDIMIEVVSRKPLNIVSSQLSP